MLHWINTASEPIHRKIYCLVCGSTLRDIKLTGRLKKVSLRRRPVRIYYNSSLPDLKRSILGHSDKYPQHRKPRNWSDGLWTHLRTAVIPKEKKNRDEYYEGKQVIGIQWASWKQRKFTYIPIILGLSVETSQAKSVPLLSPTKIHSSVGWKANALAPMSLIVLSTARIIKVSCKW